MAFLFPPPPPPPMSCFDFILSILLLLIIILPLFLVGSLIRADILLKEKTRHRSSSTAARDGPRHGGFTEAPEASTSGGNGGSQIHDAAARGHLEPLQSRLLLWNTNPGHQKKLLESHDEDGRTPLSSVAYCGHTEVVQYLLRNFPDTFYAEDNDIDKSYPIHQASIQGHVHVLQEFHRHCIRYSAEKKSDSLKNMMFRTNRLGRTILHLAAINGRAEIVRYLLDLPEAASEINREISRKDVSKSTALHLAKKKRHDEVIKILNSHIEGHRGS